MPSPQPGIELDRRSAAGRRANCYVTGLQIELDCPNYVVSFNIGLSCVNLNITKAVQSTASGKFRDFYVGNFELLEIL